ncbi:MAG: hypothetical protein KF799_04395 [Bdellovibrionales bacterium]|nr:hypothetical protein [Bdellovibrionales bacterium]
MKSVKILLAIVVLVAAAILVARQMRPSTNIYSEPNSESRAAVIGLPPHSETAPRQEADPELSKAPPAGQAFQAWLTEEARQMDLPHSDSTRKEREMTTIATKMNAPQRRALLKTAQDAKAPAGEKILAAYLLVQTGAAGTEELKELITSPVAVGGEAHSLAEMESMRDKTLRIMALDGLSSRARGDDKARAALAKTISEIQDPYIKSYAESQLSQISE